MSDGTERESIELLAVALDLRILDAELICKAIRPGNDVRIENLLFAFLNHSVGDLFGDRPQSLVYDIVQELCSDRRTFETCRIDSMTSSTLNLMKSGGGFVMNYLDHTV